MNKRKVSAVAGGLALLSLVLGFALPASQTEAQVGYGTSFTVDGNATGSGQEPAASSKPCFAGTGTPGATVTLRIEPGGTTLTATVGSDGKYSVCQSQTLSAGAYQVFVNDQLVAGFKVEAPKPPATGSGLLDEAGGSGTLLAALLAAVVIAGGTTLIARGRRS